jgi:hypothetical protein
MWESIKIMGSWDDIVKEVAAGEAVWVGDGSYNRKIAPETSGGGWIIYCPSSKASIRGNFYEILDDAGSYRAELLNLAALHILALAFMLHYTLPGSFIYGVITSVRSSNPSSTGGVSLPAPNTPTFYVFSLGIRL